MQRPQLQHEIAAAVGKKIGGGLNRTRAVNELPFLTKDVAMALKALGAGTANEGQQKLACKFIREEACEAHRDTYHKDPHDASFAQGKRFVWIVIQGAIDSEPIK